MNASASDVMHELVGFIRESSAIIHYFCDIVMVITLYNAIFEHGDAGEIILWLLIALISAAVAELLKSRLPTPLRILLQRRNTIWFFLAAASITFTTDFQQLNCRFDHTLLNHALVSVFFCLALITKVRTRYARAFLSDVKWILRAALAPTPSVRC